VSDSMTHETLVKLGVLAPWQDLIALLPEFDIDLKPEATSPRAIAEKALVERSYSNGLMAGQVLGPEDFHPIDPLESVRHDFECSLSMTLLDDGFSLERIPSEPDNHWTIRLICVAGVPSANKGWISKRGQEMRVGHYAEPCHGSVAFSPYYPMTNSLVVTGSKAILKLYV